MYDMEKIAKHEKLDDGYYHLLNDLIKYPDATTYLIWSRRGPGKTYSFLWESYYYPFNFIFLRRTNDDIDFMCDDKLDLCPYNDVCRDKGIDVRAIKHKEGLGAFYNVTENEKGETVPVGAPVGLIASLSRFKTLKGVGLSAYDFCTLDEFIPQPGEIVRRKEGEQLLSTYMTINRDRQKRGRAPLKLILFGNAEQVVTPITSTLEVIDDMIELQASGKTHMYLEKRKILLHHITEEEIPLSDEEKVGIYEMMKGTNWARKAFGGEFADNDFSCVQRRNLKGYVCLYSLIYKSKRIYVYNQGNKFYMCSKQARVANTYNLDTERDQKLFLRVQLPILKDATIEGNMYFEKYTYYDLITNFTKIF